MRAYRRSTTRFSVMKAAETLGLTIPQSLLVRTDQIIQ
jgi:hypothetical protein